MNIRFFIVLVMLLISHTASAQVVIRGATVHTMRGPAIEGGVVVLGADGKLAAVGPAGTAIPSGALIIEATGKHVTPGLIDAYTGLGAVEIDAVAETRDRDGGGPAVRAAFSVADAINPRSAVIPIQRSGGVTSALVVPSGGVISGRAAWLSLLGERPDTHATIFGRDVALAVTLGERGAAQVGGSRGALALAWAVLFDDLALYLKDRRAFDEGRTRQLAATRLDLEALGQVQAGGLPVLARVDSATDIEAAMAMATKYKLRLVVVGGAQAWMVADKLAAAKIPVILDALDNLPTGWSSMGARLDNAALLKKAGVAVIISTFDTHKVHLLRQYAGNAVRAGMAHADALVAITAAPAEALGLGKTQGALAPGMAADVVIWSGDPLELSTQVEAMYIGAKPASLDNRQRALFERYKTLERRAPAPKAEDMRP